ncbi:MAG: SCO family protein [Pyrinomonadaceae bacterium]
MSINVFNAFRLLPLLALAVALGCTSSRPRADAKRYELNGTIVSFNKDQQQVVISHKEIPGLMEAMTMPYTLREPSAYDVMKAGDAITATLVVEGDRSWIENPVVSHVEADPSAPAATAQPRDPEPGAQVPDITLTNQDGKKIRLGDYRGRALALTFIYTRCPLPDFCTLMSNNFAEINRALDKESELAGKSHLLSVSFDPANDTPKVLRSYGAAHTGKLSDEKFDRWEFATAEPAELRRLADFFGLVYQPDGDQIVHSLRTAVIAPDGKLYKLYDGNQWKPEEVVTDFRALAGEK